MPHRPGLIFNPDTYPEEGPDAPPVHGGVRGRFKRPRVERPHDGPQHLQVEAPSDLERCILRSDPPVDPWAGPESQWTPQDIAELDLRNSVAIKSEEVSPSAPAKAPGRWFDVSLEDPIAPRRTNRVAGVSVTQVDEKTMLLDWFGDDDALIKLQGRSLWFEQVPKEQLVERMPTVVYRVCQVIEHHR